MMLSVVYVMMRSEVGSGSGKGEYSSERKCGQVMRECV